MMINKETLELPSNSKVLLQLSGGKDSVACMILLRQNNISFEAIHFTHKYCYAIPTEMSVKACDSMGIKLHIVDVTEELGKILLDHFSGRPCRFCKAIMDRITIQYALDNGYHFICVGDTKDDTMLINRIKRVEGSLNKLSRYFNEKVYLPSEISIFRPLLDFCSDETYDIVIKKFPDFRRVNDTGDKYFEYSREGCPLQFKDLGAQYTKEMMQNLNYLNTLCGQFASSLNIRASIHLPSEFIITVPRGYEDKCRNYLLSKGAILTNNAQISEQKFHYVIHIKLISSMRNKDTLSIASQRFCERLGLTMAINFTNNYAGMLDKDAEVSFVLTDKARLLISLSCLKRLWDIRFVENVCLEIFHTDDYNVITYEL